MWISQGFEGEKPCIMRFLPRIKLPEALTKQPDLCKMAKRLEIMMPLEGRGFESHRLRQKKTYALIQSIGLFQRNKSLAGFVKYASRVKYCFAM